jgi:hypothetical protein
MQKGNSKEGNNKTVVERGIADKYKVGYFPRRAGETFKRFL